MERQIADREIVWRRIVENEGNTFKQKQGKEFTYTIKGNTIVPSLTQWNIPVSSFDKALAFVPLKNVAVIEKVCQGPSYVYAILMDQRIRDGIW